MPGAFELYRRLPGIVFAFHGCDKSVGEKVLASTNRHLSRSDNPYDWLGSGIYFWENDPQRALEFAQEAKVNPKLTKGQITEPFVVGAAIDLGLCLNLLDRTALAEVEGAHAFLKEVHDSSGRPMPVNTGKDRAARFLDRAVIEFLHRTRADLNVRHPEKYLPYDTVRGAFWEGGDLYPTSGFQKKSHIQIAVRNPACIRGYFRPFES